MDKDDCVRELHEQRGKKRLFLIWTKCWLIINQELIELTRKLGNYYCI